MALGAAALLPCADARAQASETERPSDDNPLKHWWFGGYYRHLWVPDYVPKLFLSRAPSVQNDGFGFTATYRSDGALNIELGGGYMPYAFHGPFLAKIGSVTDTEIARSDLGFYHLTASLLWDLKLHKMFSIELGVGIDVGFFAGHLLRNEAYLDPKTGHFMDCTGPLMPDITGPNPVAGQPPIPYCDVPENGSGVTDPPDKRGEQYHVRDNHVPPVMAFPMLPRLALRFEPASFIAIKAEFAFGIAQIWIGAALQFNFGWVKSAAPVVEPPPPAPAPPPPPSSNGRVLGRVIDAQTQSPIANATVRLRALRALSALSTENDGRFVVDRLDPGHVRFEIEHPDYTAGSCEADIPTAGGDVAIDCSLTPKPSVGAISGQLEDENSQPIAGAAIELSGPQAEKLSSDERGLFAAVDLPPGIYRIHVVADGYLAQVVEIEVAPHQTAMPQVILLKAPKRPLAQLHDEEIAISEQIQFKPGSAEILPASESLLRQVADVILRHPELEGLEVQGHTDNRGSLELNMKLSQARADAVRSWLINAGIVPTKLDAHGYGPVHPIRPNDTAANRAKNRRVQFIVKKQPEPR